MVYVDVELASAGFSEPMPAWQGGAVALSGGRVSLNVRTKTKTPSKNPQKRKDQKRLVGDVNRDARSPTDRLDVSFLNLLPLVVA